MTYQVLALKWRPQIFEDLVGQETVARTLTNAIQQNRIANAFIFSGVRGVGKTTTARILAKALNCASGPTVRPCGSCPACEEIATGSSLDVLEIDGASNNGVEQVREIIEGSRYAASRDRFKIYIIDEVHMLSTSAFNALLKTLEEPPPSVKFIFATTELHKIPDTILSRCQEFEFRTVASGRIGEHLKKIAASEKVTISERALAQIARAAEGSLRDALSAFDQVIAATGETIEESDVTELLGLIEHDVLLDTLEAIVAKDTASILGLVDRLVGSGRDLRHFATGLMQCFRDVLVVNVAPSSPGLVLYSEDRERLEALASELSEEDLVRSLDILTQVESSLRWSPEPRFHLEMALLKLSQLRHLASFEELLERFEALSGETHSTSSSGPSGPSGTPGASSGSPARREPAKPVGGAEYRRRTRTAPATEPAEPISATRPSTSTNDVSSGVSTQTEAPARPEPETPVETGTSGNYDNEGPPPFEGYDEEFSATPPGTPSAPVGAGADAPPERSPATATTAGSSTPEPVPRSNEPANPSGLDEQASELAESLMDVLRKKKPMLRAMLSHHHTVTIQGEELQFHFESTETLIVEQLLGPDSRALMDGELAQLATKPIRISAVVTELPQTPSPQSDASEAPFRDTAFKASTPSDAGAQPTNPATTSAPSETSRRNNGMSGSVESTPTAASDSPASSRPNGEPEGAPSATRSTKSTVSTTGPPTEEPSADALLDEKARNDPLVQQFLSTFKGEVERIVEPGSADSGGSGPPRRERT